MDMIHYLGLSISDQPVEFNQFLKLLELLDKTAGKSYTITGATDWPMLMAIGGIVIILVGVMWRDLRSMMSNAITALNESVQVYRKEARDDINTLREENDKDHDALRAEINNVRDSKLDKTLCLKCKNT